MLSPPRDPNVYRLTQFVEGSTLLTSSVVSQQFGGIGATLSQLNQVGTLQALFDQYRINLVEVWIIPDGAAAGDTIAMYVSAIDYTDTTNFSNVADGMDYATAVVSQLPQAQYRCFRPHIAVAAYAGAFTSFANEESPWIDCASPAVVHYGLKVGCEMTTVATPIRYMLRLHVEFRDIV